MKKPITVLALLTYAALVLEANAQRAYVGSSFHLNLGGLEAGYLKSVEGGAITAEVIEEPLPGSFTSKRPGEPRFEPFRIQFGLGAIHPSVSDWISASWNQDNQRKDGSIIAADFQQVARSRREFFGAVITETTLPACDAAGKEPAYLTLKFAPEYTRRTKASGRVAGDFGRAEQKAWLPSNFRLTIDGLDCTRVVRIESFTVKAIQPREAAGQERDYHLEPGRVEFPHLKITMPAAGSQTWQDWFESFVIKGVNASQNEKSGTLEFLSPNRKEVLATVEFTGLGIFRLEASAPHDNADQIGRVTAELYCERMKWAASR